MKKSLKFSLLILSLMSSCWAMGQKGILKGKVIEDATGEPLYFANVVIKGTQEGVSTDFDGNFEIKVEAGTYDVQVSFIGLSPSTISAVSIQSGEVTVLENIRLENATSELQTVTITADAVRNTEEALISVKRKSVSVMDGISAAKLRKTGDADAGDAAKRVTGVSVEGGKYVFVRGLGDRYTKTMLNGVDIPGLDPDRNAIQIDIFPTSLLENMTVLKSAVAELPADFSGGVVNIETKDLPGGKIAGISFSLGFNPAMHFNEDYLTYEGGTFDFLGFDDGLRKLPAEAQQDPIPNPINNNNGVNEFMQKFSPNLGALQKRSFMDFGLGFSLGNQKMLESGNKWGYILAATYKNTTNFYDDVIFGEYYRSAAETDYELEYTTIRRGAYGQNNILLGGIGGLVYKTMRSKYQLTLLHLQNGEKTAGQFDVDNSEAAGQSGYIAYTNNLSYSQRALTNLLISGEHNLVNDKWLIEWKISPTYSRITEPDLRSTSFTITPQGDSVFNSGAGGNPSRIWRYLDEVNAVARLDLSRTMKLFGEEAKLKFGGSHVFKYRDYSILSYELQYFGGSEPVLNGNPDEVMKDENLYQNGKGYYLNSGNGSPNSNEYQSNIQNSAAYVSAEFVPIKRLKSVLGLRVENFVQRHTGRDQFGAIGASNGNVLENEVVLSSFDLFPSANLIYALHEEQNLRFSYFRSIARPSFKELSYAQILDPVSNRIFNGGLFVYPDWNGSLDATRIQNLDIRWEMFMKRGELLSFSAFAKFFNNPIELVRIASAQTSSEFQPRNMGDGKVYGAEMEFRKNLTFISPKFQDLSLSANFTYVYSRIEMTATELTARLNYRKAGQEIEGSRPMAGQAPFIINGGLNYNNDKSGLNAGFFYNVKGRTLEVVGGALFPDVYTQTFHSLNLTAGKTFGAEKKNNISLKISNLLGDKRESTYSAYKAQDQIFTYLDPGREISISYSYKF